MELHAYTRTISDLFSVKKKYVVPRFQREYSWTKEQVRELWEDIISNIKINNESAFEHEEYFLGALVLVGDDKSSSLEIVDGQQRLTTLTILLSALCHRFIELNKQNIATAIHENYIVGKDDDGNDYFKLENETPKPFFQTNIQHINRDESVPKTEEEKTLLSAYKDFYSFTSISSLRSSINSELIEDNEQYEKALKAIRDQVVKYLKVIFITVSKEDEAYTIFETLNARGMNLSFVDLIKNKLFKNLNQTHPDDIAKTKWKEIRNIISSRSGVGSLENFVRHWWISKYSYVSADNVYKAFKKLWNKDQIDANLFISRLHKDANIYVKIASPVSEDFRQQEEKDIYRALLAFRIFGITQHRPFLLSVFRAKETKILKLGDVKEILIFLEKFHFKFNAICSLRPSGIEGSYSKAARELISANNRAKALIILEDLKERLSDRQPEETVFIDKFSQLRYSSRYTKDKKLIQYIYKYIECFKQSTSEFKPENLSLEHILPQSYSEDIYIETIGNLIPLGQKLNEEAGNKPVVQKIEIYKRSNYELTRNFANSFTGVWDQNSINQRTQDLACYCFNIAWSF